MQSSQLKDKIPPQAPAVTSDFFAISRTASYHKYGDNMFPCQLDLVLNARSLS